MNCFTRVGICKSELIAKQQRDRTGGTYERSELVTCVESRVLKKSIKSG